MQQRQRKRGAHSSSTDVELPQQQAQQVHQLLRKHPSFESTSNGYGQEAMEEEGGRGAGTIISSDSPLRTAMDRSYSSSSAAAAAQSFNKIHGKHKTNNGVGPSFWILRLALLVPLLTLGVILQAGLHAAVPSHSPTIPITGSLPQPPHGKSIQELLLHHQQQEASFSSPQQQALWQYKQQGRPQRQAKSQTQNSQRQNYLSHPALHQQQLVVQEKQEQKQKNQPQQKQKKQVLQERQKQKNQPQQKKQKQKQRMANIPPPHEEPIHPDGPLDPVGGGEVFYKINHVPKKFNAELSTTQNVQYHIIFSTGCSVYQDWQSYVLFYHVYASRQPGNVTRIVSGCATDDDRQKVQTWFDQTIRQPMQNDVSEFHLHFTPDYGAVIPEQQARILQHTQQNLSTNNQRKKRPKQLTVHQYKYYNKPFGTKHWMEHALGYSFTTTKTERVANRNGGKNNNSIIYTTETLDNPAHDDTIIILLDPDQIILRPFVRNDFTQDGWKFLDSDEVPQTAIRHGAPMGQMYGFSVQWKTKVNTTQLLGPLAATVQSPIDDLSMKQAQKSYIVGPPYIATARDMYAIARQWSYFVPRVHDQYPFLLAEMFAYSLAAAHLRLPHQTARTFMISALDGYNSEGWYLIDLFNATANNATTTTTVKTNNVESINQEHHLQAICANNQTFLRQERDEGRLVLPRVFHYCQRYSWGPYFFGKNRFPRNFLSCPMPLLAEPPVNLWKEYESAWMLKKDSVQGLQQTAKRKFALRQGFSVCTMIHAVNNAARHFKQHQCRSAALSNIVKNRPSGGGNDSAMVANFNTTLVFTREGQFQSPEYTLYKSR
ncbi:hypothetical protein ACA910_014942 [Epithemia clementina (nom. ined.)]